MFHTSSKPLLINWLLSFLYIFLCICYCSRFNCYLIFILLFASCNLSFYQRYLTVYLTFLHNYCMFCIETLADSPVTPTLPSLTYPYCIAINATLLYAGVLIYLQQRCKIQGLFKALNCTPVYLWSKNYGFITNSTVLSQIQPFLSQIQPFSFPF